MHSEFQTASLQINFEPHSIYKLDIFWILFQISGSENNILKRPETLVPESQGPLTFPKIKNSSSTSYMSIMFQS